MYDEEWSFLFEATFFACNFCFCPPFLLEPPAVGDVLMRNERGASQIPQKLFFPTIYFIFIFYRWVLLEKNRFFCYIFVTLLNRVKIFHFPRLKGRNIFHAKFLCGFEGFSRIFWVLPPENTQSLTLNSLVKIMLLFHDFTHCREAHCNGKYFHFPLKNHFRLIVVHSALCFPQKLVARALDE